MTKEITKKSFALCIENKECEDLVKRKIYTVLPDDKAVEEGYLRIIDESGEDYLYPQSYFILVKLPQKAQDALKAGHHKTMKKASTTIPQKYIIHKKQLEVTKLFGSISFDKNFDYKKARKNR